MLEPAGHRVLIRPEKFEEIFEEGALKGFAINIGDEWRREKGATTIGVVVAIGPSAWQDFVVKEPWTKVGNKVYYAKYSGKNITHNDIEYVMINDEDIIANIIEEDEDE